MKPDAVNFGDPRLPDRKFWGKCIPEPNSGCWLWLGKYDRHGYGRSYLGHNRYAHRVSYAFLVGPIPSGLVIDHLCRTPACCNPTHLEAVAHGENTRRGAVGAVNRKRLSAITHCPRGHEYDEANTYVKASASGGRNRVCRACQRTNMNERNRRKAAAGIPRRSEEPSP